MKRFTQALFALFCAGLGVVIWPAYETLRPARPSVEFLGPSVTDYATPEEYLTVRFEDVRRNEACGGSILVRWREDDNGKPGQLVARFHRPTFEVVQADVTPEPASFQAVIPVYVPDEPGTWWYSPILQPHADCSDTTPIVPPPMRVVVTLP